MQMTNRYLIECTQHVLGPIPRQWVTNYVIPRIEAFKQDGKSINKYTTEFLELSKYAPTVVATEVMKVKRFLKGLVKRYVNLAMLADQPFDTMVNRAHQVEMRYEVEGNAKSKKYKTEGQSSAQNLSYNGAFHMGSSGGPSQSSHKTSLNNLNKGDIDTRVEVIDKVIALIVVGRIVDRVVQGSRSLGRGQMQSSMQLGKGHAQVFTLTHQDAQASNVVVSAPRSLECSLEVATPIICLVKVNDKNLPLDLISLPIMDFYIILEMDWLSNHYTTLDCRNRKVIFHILRTKEFSFDGTGDVAPYNLVSTISVRKMLRRGCQCYLVLVRDISLESPSVNNIPMVREFSDVFSDDLPRLPFNKEIEFYIDVIPDTNSISMSPYRMAPVELKELKEQLQELLEKRALFDRVHHPGVLQFYL
ncbi:hypothetical protein MANES_04G070250v8 [Manihot esculenta]|uniref:Uncharacterized protein n=1 Tax=Manihot esculenta TaxID=3983 RepID=A0ACB7HVU3_MANES|nr:hypothetical protein MANES_04G070250v8 [Manihot esculenta]